jgi:hypothetical protein
MKKTIKNVLMFTLLAVMMVIGNPNTVYSQGVTTASVSGKITDVANEVLSGATVVATHKPSGSRYGVISNSEGRYNIVGMRIGGPYLIEVSFIGYSTKTMDGVYLNLGVTSNINVVLEDGTTELGEVTVSVDRNSVFSSERTGASTAITSQNLNRLPTISRNINDFTRLSPQASGNSFAGQDGRLNNITVDGSYFNNSFGLGSGSNPGGRTGVSPISLDAIEQISINVAPYDVRQGNFVGAGINTVTKSGTNEFSGSVYGFSRNNNLVGTKAGDKDFNPGQFDYKQYGFRLGGPIVKNKLFFFGSFEDEKNVTPGTTFRLEHKQK